MADLRLILSTTTPMQTGVVKAAAFGCDISCADGECIPYGGTVPAGYTSLEDWYAKESEHLNCWSATVMYSSIVGTHATNLTKTSEPAAAEESRETLAVSEHDATRATINNASAYYNRPLRMAFIRLSLDLVTALSAGSTRTVAGVDNRVPGYQHALAVYCSGQASAYIGNTGKITLRAHEDLAAGETVIITGWWVVTSSQQ